MKKIYPIGLYALAALALLFGLAALRTRAADHLDAPGLTSPGGDGRLDLNDVYAFQSPANPDNTVLIVTLNPVAGVLSPKTFHPTASYEFKVDANGDAKEDQTFKITFSPTDSAGQQDILLRLVPARGSSAVLARGRTGEGVPVAGGGTLHAGVFDDPFFFDLLAFLGASGRSFCDGGESDFFTGLNVSAIVLEVPSALFGTTNIGVWARTELDGQQIDRNGRPAINTVFIPNNPFEPVGSEPSQKNAFNAGKPRQDPRNFRGEVVDTLQLFYPAGDPTIDALADILLPDILTVDTASSAGFLNGRRLADDVIDAELTLVTNGAVTSDCVGANDSPFANTFPYLAPAH
jgi:hypothetical protein